MIDLVIKRIIKDIGVSVLLNCKVFKGIIDVHYYNWMDAQRKFYSMMIPCSSAMVYTKSSLNFDNHPSLEESVIANLKVFETKAEWCAGMWSEQYAMEYSRALEKSLQERSNEVVTYEEYKTLRIQFNVEPVLGVTVWYQKNETIGVFNVSHGAITTVITDDPDFQGFIEALGLNRNVTIMRTKKPVLCLEEIK